MFMTNREVHPISPSRPGPEHKTLEIVYWLNKAKNVGGEWHIDFTSFTSLISRNGIKTIDLLSSPVLWYRECNGWMFSSPYLPRFTSHTNRKKVKRDHEKKNLAEVTLYFESHFSVPASGFVELEQVIKIQIRFQVLIQFFGFFRAVLNCLMAGRGIESRRWDLVMGVLRSLPWCLGEFINKSLESYRKPLGV